MRIKIKNSDTFVILEDYNGAVESHPVLTDFPEQYELTTDEPTESSNYFVCTYKGDPRNAPEYYKVRSEAGTNLVNDVTNQLLLKYNSGEMTLQEIVAINKNLKDTTELLMRGQIIIAEYELSVAQNVPSDMRSYIASSIQELKAEHYISSR